MNQEELKELLSKYLSGASLTEEELEQLRLWDTSFESAPRLTEQLSDLGKDRMRQRMWEHIDEATTQDIYPMRSPKRWLLKIAVAASLVIAIGTAWLIIGKKEKQHITSQPIASMDITPGSNKAILTLSDGTNIPLDDAKNGLIAHQGSTSILKVDSGQIAYNDEKAAGQDIAYNTIRTPAGGQYTVILPDGTRVILNAASSLRFPAAFTGTERNVELTGEAYFDVVHNEAMPFVVKAGALTIRDVGTAFNINVYDDEPEQQVTLVEGLADVTHAGTDFRLQPGHAAYLNAGRLGVKDGDVENAIAWRNGLFQYKAASLDKIMRQVARWYNVEVVYEGPVKKTAITGKALRSTSLQEMLQILESSGARFRVTNRTIYVSG